jgi:hypothetical protein
MRPVGVLFNGEVPRILRRPTLYAWAAQVSAPKKAIRLFVFLFSMGSCYSAGVVHF